MNSDDSKRQKAYNSLLALGGKNMPPVITLSKTWYRVKVFKHDFFAATGLYQAGEEQVVVKIYRPRHYYGIPCKLLSMWQAHHEQKIYRQLQDTPCVPKWIGKYNTTGIIHEYVPGRHLQKDNNVDAEFFEQLEQQFLAMHQRGIAYLDTNKRDNILLGDDGKPYLIDFQISWLQPFFPLNLITWPLFAIFKRADLYHLAKHRRKLLAPTEGKRKQIPWFIRIHRRLANPIRRWRRNYLRKVESKAKIRPEGSEKH